MNATARTVPSLLVDRLLGRGQVPTPAAVTDMDLVPAHWGRRVPLPHIYLVLSRWSRDLTALLTESPKGDQLVVRSSLGSLGESSGSGTPVG